MEMSISLQHTTYAPFGSVLTTTGTGQHTSYIGREADNETGLGNYGVRLYEPEYGRFMSVDVLWGEYEGWQPYQYALNAPLSFRDEGGMWVQAMNEAARQAIRESVPAKFRSAVQFSESGVVLKEPLLAAARGQDVNSNVAILSRLAENEQTVQVTVTDEFQWKDVETGEVQTRKFSENSSYHYGDVPEYGITLLPEKDRQAANVPSNMPVSTNGVTQVVINPSPLVKGLSKGQTTAHELFGHFRFLLLAKQGKAVGAAHQTSDGLPNKQVDDACRAAELGVSP
ncbi:MAG: RHS repeat-associated core domain-containing protein [Chlorobi bacterium]|nr:RHS repeat-associated core domain-containing protein [Chlorobiota bacterium]NOG68657.1 RHS repeat-associated core domain-containing protein [Chlorobiota bacterium]